jgi:hypothetical protein
MAVAEMPTKRDEVKGYKRAVAVPIETLSGQLPQAQVPEDIDASDVAASMVDGLEALRIDALADDAFWRDSYTLTGTVRTFLGAETVLQAWKETSALHRPTYFKLTPNTSRIMRHSAEISWVQAHFTFQTTACSPLKDCSGFLSLVPGAQTGTWKIWMVRTILENFQGHANPDVLNSRPSNSVNGSNGVSSHYDCVVVGGGQSGLSTGGRCQALGLSYVILDKHPNVGDSWRSRYDSTKRECDLA